MRRVLPDAALLEIEQAIAAGEALHSAEVRFVVEAAFPIGAAWRGVSARDRAVALFSQLRVWDTEQNNGVLLYLLMADRAIEIVSDRAVSRVVPPERWQAVCNEFGRACSQGRFREGALAAIAAIHDLIRPHFPPGARNPDELPNRPVVL